MNEIHPLTAFRKQERLTQEKLAQKLEVSRTTIARWEGGSRRIDDALVSRVSSFTGIPAAVLRPDLDELMRSPPSEQQAGAA